ncbi:hypothetical protein F3Y22_tig00002511pilonHSYRG00493 [Hibiscus syriacus]|uniref:Uncharacterized protein n=1 Tax=Hibiscus syriacus TaxID=106335 RepID=A0A6A3CTM8_HIBSY|nr:uncharacterized protein LOC120145927 [Hibiscus syriacus]KAE8731864.1 hypothetical protein F3Y22_tig00002511pilonHSYRG00493 [Hibiscus syriacus]
MALRTVGLIGDQNINVHYNGASVVSKENMATAPRKGGIGGRKALRDISNSGKTTLKETSKKSQPLKENSKVLAFTEKETTVSKITRGSSNTKSASKASEKVQVGARKALCDISNSMFTISEENPPPIEMHNHDECIKAQETIRRKEFLQIFGLEDEDEDKDEWYRSEDEDEEMTDLLIKDWSPPKHMIKDWYSAPPRPSPKLMDC